MCGLNDHFDLIGQKSHKKTKSKKLLCQMNLFEWLVFTTNEMIKLECHSRENGNPQYFFRFLLEFIPMKIGAGMTKRKVEHLI